MGASDRQETLSPCAHVSLTCARARVLAILVLVSPVHVCHHLSGVSSRGCLKSLTCIISLLCVCLTLVCHGHEKHSRVHVSCFSDHERADHELGHARLDQSQCAGSWCSVDPLTSCMGIGGLQKLGLCPALWPNESWETRRSETGVGGRGDLVQLESGMGGCGLPRVHCMGSKHPHKTLSAEMRSLDRQLGACCCKQDTSPHKW